MDDKLGGVVPVSAIDRAGTLPGAGLVARPADVTALQELIDRYPCEKTRPIYLQPLSLSAKATELCVASATANGWRVSLQTHKLAGWR